MSTLPESASTVSHQRVEFRGSKVARGLLRLAGWRVDFDGLPGLQGVIAVYPHTSNWDFIVGLLAKWAMGIQVRFWGKDSLFKVPGFAAWMRWLGGVAINRKSSSGVVGHTINEMTSARAEQRLYWLVLAPEGTRSLTAGWRSGFYRVAHGAQVPLVIATIDYGHRVVRLRDALMLSGDAQVDMAAIARCVGDARGHRAELAAPIKLL
jgi:1-acyl-sn-glycerol-3-phosphate acyltransferase